jgi:serine/threonine protein kinase
MSTARRIYELLGANAPKFHWATFRDGKIDTGDHVFTLDNYLARGNYGMVFATKTYVIKIEDSYEQKFNETDITQYASHEGIGPLVWMRGELRISMKDAREFIENLERKNIFAPWVVQEQSRFWYSVTERWSTSLGAYLESMSSSHEAFLALEPQVIQKIIDLVQKLHKVKIVHLDMHHDNVLINLENGVITDVTLTDFGASMLRSQYFYNYSNQIRHRRIFNFLEQKPFTQLASTVAKLTTGLHPRVALERWLINEPFNIDLMRVHAYALHHPSYTFANLPKLTMPENFRFELPWQETDLLRKVQVKIDGVVSEVTVDVFGKMKVSMLRTMITRKIPEARGKKFVHGENGNDSLVELETESTLFSRVLPIMVADQVFIEMRED